MTSDCLPRHVAAAERERTSLAAALAGAKAAPEVASHALHASEAAADAAKAQVVALRSQLNDAEARAVASADSIERADDHTSALRWLWFRRLLKR